MYGLTDDELGVILRVLRAHGVRSCVLFGSRAKGTFKPSSDVDLAVDTHEDDVAFELNEDTILPYTFDVININTIANENLREHICRVGKILI